jgi:hypothetical protein
MNQFLRIVLRFAWPRSAHMSWSGTVCQARLQTTPGGNGRTHL